MSSTPSATGNGQRERQERAKPWSQRSTRGGTAGPLAIGAGLGWRPLDEYAQLRDLCGVQGGDWEGGL
jgi:hypothetical protein